VHGFRDAVLTPAVVPNALALQDQPDSTQRSQLRVVEIRFYPPQKEAIDEKVHDGDDFDGNSGCARGVRWSRL
jgi:hypothetical protein